MDAPVEKVCIAIPVYKPFAALSASEVHSIKQCFQVLGKYPITFFGPVHFDYQPYIDFAKEYEVKAKPVQFQDSYFKNLAGYNKLLLSITFYRAFSFFEYLLLYQPDAWVFKDELKYWCDKSFDYIGAPWFEGYERPVENPKIIGVGNGGFSLRKIHSYLKILKTFSYISPPNEIWKGVNRNASWYSFPISILRYLLNVTIKNNTHYWFNSFDGQEDGFWGDFAGKNFSWFKVADYEFAFRFSFETCPERLYQLNKNTLPFGCHAWEKHNPEFWKQFIRV